MKGRLYALDAMRGAAALVVVYYHSSVITDAVCFQATCNVRFGFLAVDMFFALSGFVLSHSYDRHFEDGLGNWAFMKKRLVRLMPIYWLGLLIGLPVALLEAAKGLQPVDDFIGMAAFNSVILPFPGLAPQTTVVSMLRPAWSLFFELWIANLAFALFWRHLRGMRLAALIATSFMALTIAASHHGSLDMGPVWDSFAGGFPRVLFSFFLGVALRRGSARLPVLRLPAPLVVGATVVTFFMPVPRGWEPIFELACVALVYPVLIHAGATATLRRPRIAELLGDTSYALYLIHMPLLDLWGKAMRKVGLTPSPVAAGLFVTAAVLLALAVDRYYDRRARLFLVKLIELERPRVIVTAAGRPLPVESASATGWAMQSTTIAHTAGG